MATDKTWRNFELVLYPENIEDERFEKALEKLKKWAWILHDKDADRVVHAHLYGQPNSPLKTSTICKLFGIRENQIEKIKGTWNDAIDYLTHGNAETKYQYDESEVHANYDWREDAKGSTRNVKKKLQEIVNQIGVGTIREYNLHDFVTVEEYTKYRRKIEDAFKWRKGYVLAHLEELVEMKNVVWVFGQTGTGKTTFAKGLAKSAGLFFALTSTGRNMFDEYRDEPCLIIDDLRPEDMKFSDLLGILDPYNFKAAQARYANKALQTQMLIVTTTKSPEQFCRECNGDALNAEDERQLYRRINTVYEVTKKLVIEYYYNDDFTHRVQGDSYPNMWLIMQKRKKDKELNRSLVTKQLEAMLNMA